jgi:hypothetical protein
MFTSRGKLLFLSNHSQLLAAVLDRIRAAPAKGSFTYAAGLRHAGENSSYDRVMTALDFSAGGMLAHLNKRAKVRWTLSECERHV